MQSTIPPVHCSHIAMKTSQFIVALTISLSLPLIGNAELRDWTNATGKTISAELLSVEGEDITLKMDNGRQYTLPLNSLSEADAAFARHWQAELEAIASAPKPSSEPLMTIPGKVIYQTDFTEIDSEWKANIGDWSASDDGLSGVEVADDDHGGVMKRALTLKNVIVEYQVMLGDTKGTAFGFDNNDHIARVSLSPAGFSAQKDDNDHEGPDAAKPFNKIAEEMATDEWHTIRIELLGEEMLAQTGEHISMGADPLLAADKTKWGFVVSGGPVSIRNLTVWEALPNDTWEQTRDRLKRKLDIED